MRAIFHGRQPEPEPERCAPHDLLPGQCECTTRVNEPDYAKARAIVQRDFGYVEEAPQVTARVAAQPTTDVLGWRPRLGHQIPTIDYGHWTVLVDDSATRDLRAERERIKAERARAALIDALMGHNAIGATITIS